jgi:hypothetical protein
MILKLRRPGKIEDGEDGEVSSGRADYRGGKGQRPAR